MFNIIGTVTDTPDYVRRLLDLIPRILIILISPSLSIVSLVFLLRNISFEFYAIWILICILSVIYMTIAINSLIHIIINSAIYCCNKYNDVNDDSENNISKYFYKYISDFMITIILLITSIILQIYFYKYDIKEQSFELYVIAYIFIIFAYIIEASIILLILFFIVCGPCLCFCIICECISGLSKIGG
jgi:hypothetical protein